MRISLGPPVSLAALTFFTALTTSAYGQTARITGTVTDQTKAAAHWADLLDSLIDGQA